MPIIYVDPVLIEQVLVNLMKNAAEAMADVKPASVDGVIRVVADIEAGFVDIRVIGGRASTKRPPSACLNRFTAPSPMAWAWG